MRRTRNEATLIVAATSRVHTAEEPSSRKTATHSAPSRSSCEKNAHRTIAATMPPRAADAADQRNGARHRGVVDEPGQHRVRRRHRDRQQHAVGGAPCDGHPQFDDPGQGQEGEHRLAQKHQDSAPHEEPVRLVPIRQRATVDRKDDGRNYHRQPDPEPPTDANPPSSPATSPPMPMDWTYAATT